MSDGPDAAQFWDARYAGEEYCFGTAPNAFLARETVRLSPGMEVLAVADGEGRNSVWLAQHGMRVHAVDVSTRALEKARALASTKQVEVRFERADLDRWVWPEARYDAVAAIFIQFAPPDLRARLFDGIKRALQPGGLLLLEGYRPEQLGYGTGGPSTPDNLYDDALLRAAFGDFDILALEAYDAEVDEGPGHRGLSALIDLVARKPL